MSNIFYSPRGHCRGSAPKHFYKQYDMRQLEREVVFFIIKKTVIQNRTKVTYYRIDLTIFDNPFRTNDERTVKSTTTAYLYFLNSRRQTPVN
jgi:hypothetical protein